jgi:uncharacterized protein Yka (UPF0111/DUF47 family)
MNKDTRKPAPQSLWEEPRELTQEEAAARVQRRHQLTAHMLAVADQLEAHINTYASLEGIKDVESFADTVAIELYNRAFRRGITR